MKQDEHERAMRIVRYLKRAYPVPRSELKYGTPFQFLAAVVLSAQCTDKLVNSVTEKVFKNYATPADFARLDPARLAKEIARISFFRTKAKHIVNAAKILEKDFRGVLPRTAAELQKLPGVGYKTAHVILGELFDVWEGIPTDTHVKRFARKFALTKQRDLKKISHDLERLIPQRDWKYVNNGLVLYGRYVCPARRHECSAHPLTRMWPPAARRWPQTGDR